MLGRRKAVKQLKYQRRRKIAASAGEGGQFINRGLAHDVAPKHGGGPEAWCDADANFGPWSMRAASDTSTPAGALPRAPSDSGPTLDNHFRGHEQLATDYRFVLHVVAQLPGVA